MSIRALTLWEKYQKLFRKPILSKTGTLWFCQNKDDELINTALLLLGKNDIS